MFQSKPFERQDSKPTASERRAGFTLIEALVALAIVAISLTAIGSLTAANIRAPRKIEQHLGLVETLRAIETGLPDRANLSPGNLSGELAAHQWLVEIQSFPDEIVDSPKPNPWAPQSVAIIAQSPSGATLRIDTIRLRQVAGQ
ncbi:prepilin-type N-terminal cleavage/methylation domain-containing protein [Methylocapsa polymorpha]|uniref:Prepilin-type N-terminal cleavage/methylation domain-containing protein n=1 Tax=Methylocapsa polymorpha TaxID=3080828 RepID=A0ABZ0HUD4_9HYPH|nr:prepilin-type N-terminal cleavage/methylation domain-containing protein [Methylocapsa sp. RX1]